MKTSIVRTFLVFGAAIVAFEVVLQLGVHWRESTSELCEMALMLALLPALFWATRPALAAVTRRWLRVPAQMAAVVVLFAASYTAIYFYSWHVRPNIGVYREPEWVAQHPGFQRELRAKIEANRWRVRDIRPTEPRK